MNGYKVAIIALYVIAALASVLGIGKEQKPTTPVMAAATLVITGGMCVLVVLA